MRIAALGRDAQKKVAAAVAKSDAKRRRGGGPEFLAKRRALRTKWLAKNPGRLEVYRERENKKLRGVPRLRTKVVKRLAAVAKRPAAL